MIPKIQVKSESELYGRPNIQFGALAEPLAARRRSVIEAGSSCSVDGEKDGRIRPRGDLRRAEDVQRFLANLPRCGPVDQFFWVAGRLLKGSFSEQSPEDIRLVYRS